MEKYCGIAEQKREREEWEWWSGREREEVKEVFIINA